jgi:hypothetical protein
MSQLNFDASRVAPDTGVPDPIPAGWYNVMVVQSELKPTNDGQGAYLECVYQVLDGQFAQRKVFGRFNMRNASAQAQEIAHKQFSALCHAVNVLQVADSQQLHGLPLKIKVSLRPARTDQETGKSYEASNDVRGWKNINEPVESAAVPGAAPASGVPAGFGPPAGQPPATWGAPVAMPPTNVAPPWQGGPAPAAQPPAAAPAWQAPQPPQAPAQPWQQAQPPAAPPQQWQQPAQAPAQPPAQAPTQAPPWQQGAPAGAVPPWQQQPPR